MFELLKIIEFWPGVGQNFKQSLKSPKQASAIFMLIYVQCVLNIDNYKNTGKL